MSLRVGQGFDIHPFSDDPGRALVLGGVRVEGRGLSGHSDGDVVCHAVADALLGAAWLGELALCSPTRTPLIWGRQPGLLASVVEQTDPEWRPINVDCTVIAEAPRLAPFKETIWRRQLAGRSGRAGVRQGQTGRRPRAPSAARKASPAWRSP